MIQYFALCGAPESGKSEVQKILHQEFNVRPVDDKRGLRDAAKVLYGLSEDDVSTQAGKKKLITIGSKTKTVREILGELGEYLEENDPLHFPRMARRMAELNHPGERVSFGSVRMNQGLLFKDEQSLVIEVKRPGFSPRNNFDLYEPDLADVSVLNDYDPDDADGSTKRLIAEVRAKITPYLSR
tara:strand:+ start:597 stop:1148 length:552 start_codon:yes stop_codon:yes gene_type:complete